MGFHWAACAAFSGSMRVRAIVAAGALFCISVTFVSCGSSSHTAPRASSHTAYVTLPDRGSVLLLHIDGATGAITRGAETPQVSGTSPNGIALLPSKKFLYTANALTNNISIFKVASDGTLSLVGTPTPGGSGPHVAAIDPSGKYLLVTNSFSNDISVFSIDASSGALTEVAGSPFPANDSPGEIVILRSSNYVYVTNASIGMVTAFAFDPNTGILTTVPGSPFVSGLGASGLATDGGESYLYVANTSAANPGSTAVGNISGFTINKTNGALTPIQDSPFTSRVGTGPTTVVADPNGRFLFATTPGSSYSIWAFDIDSTTGKLAALSNSPFSVSAGGNFALIDTSGNYFYIGGQSSNGIAGYTYDNNTGAQTAITGSPFSTIVAPGKMVISH
jgi:6-phosphogluconolactonase (cycloisomerase 2 family)